MTIAQVLLPFVLGLFFGPSVSPPSVSPDTASPAVHLSPAQAHVVRHLNGALRSLTQRELSSLTASQRANRAAAIALLEAYRDAGEYPQNRDFTGEYVPYFVDPVTDAHCAVGHLMAQTGHQALVRRIAAADNHVRVLDLAADPEVAAWLDEYGITLEEAARIQPAYDWEPGPGGIITGGPANDNPLTNETALKATAGVTLGLFALQRFTPFGRKAAALPAMNIVLGFVGMGLAAAAPGSEPAAWRGAALATSAATFVSGISGVQGNSTSRLQVSVQPGWDARQVQARVRWRF